MDDPNIIARDSGMLLENSAYPVVSHSFPRQLILLSLKKAPVEHTSISKRQHLEHADRVSSVLLPVHISTRRF
jgi:hypothetical protein